jgi:hypothetical protein
MSKTLVITALVVAILTIGLVATAVSPVFADKSNNQKTKPILISKAMAILLLPIRARE